MHLSALAADAELVIVGDHDDPEISAIDYDSRAVTQGSLFCCLRGRETDGHEFAGAALAAGARAILVDHRLELAVPQVVVSDTREAMGLLASAHNGHPSRKLRVVGVTGTNGKTTTTYMVASICRAAGRNAEVIGTLTGPRTTPESPDLQKRLAELAGAGVDVAAMEVSSHALEQHRVSGTRFTVAGFTNLSPDHLDYHGDLDSYFAAKAQLFTPRLADAAVVHTGSAWGAKMSAVSQVRTVEVSDDVEADSLEVTATTSRFRWRGRPVVLPVAGRFNVSNAVLAAAMCAEIGIADADIAVGLSTLDQVPGRFQLIDAGQPYRIVVDYAHTPDGLEQLLASVREITPGGAVTVVFGCGGDRDRAKRPLMGEVAGRLADRVIVTSDNPRGEDPDQIIAAIIDGLTDTAADVRIEPDREAAISVALEGASDDDVVVIAGKGHEATQVVGEQVLAFDDAEVARRLVQRSMGGATT